MSFELGYLGTLGTLSIVFLLFVLAKLSERLGSVEKMAPLYRYYYVAMALAGIGYLVHLVAFRAQLTPENFPDWVALPWLLVAIYDLPLAVSVSIGLFVSWRYWSWLVTQEYK